MLAKFIARTGVVCAIAPKDFDMVNMANAWPILGHC